VLTVLAIAPMAAAQGVGIQVDPNSPSGTEYQLPLERARQDAQQVGPPKKVRPGARTAPAFGEGIRTPPPSAPAPKNEGADRGRATTRGALKKRASGADVPQATTTEVPLPPPPPGAAKAAGGPGASLLGVGAIAAGVLALGAGIGLLLRRRTRAS
jgi:hypothetical protein